MDYAKVHGHDSLIRDMSTGAIINNDSTSIESRRKSKVLVSAIEDINNLKNELSEIKYLLKEIIKNGN